LNSKGEGTTIRKGVSESGDDAAASTDTTSRRISSGGFARAHSGFAENNPDLCVP
jgi:hypothetical protein